MWFTRICLLSLKTVQAQGTLARRWSVMTSWAHYSEPTRPCTAITLLQGAKSIFTGMLMALEVSGAPHRVLLGPTESSNNSGSGALTKHLSETIMTKTTLPISLHLNSLPQSSGRQHRGLCLGHTSCVSSTSMWCYLLLFSAPMLTESSSHTARVRRTFHACLQRHSTRDCLVWFIKAGSLCLSSLCTYVYHYGFQLN